MCNVKYIIAQIKYNKQGNVFHQLQVKLDLR